jgi:cytoskeletal protein RodZ
MGSLGSYLKRERELRQMSIAELAQITRIPARVLQHLENDAHSELPADVFVRGFLRSYANALGLDDESVLARYRGRESQEPPPSLPAVYAPEPGRRFGIAIALFILLILFTLALSIVLRPRHRDAPLELSFQSVRAVPCQFETSSPKPSSYAASTTASPIASSRC